MGISSEKPPGPTDLPDRASRARLPPSSHACAAPRGRRRRGGPSQPRRIAVFDGATGNTAGVSAFSGPLVDPAAEVKTPTADGDDVLRLSWHGYQTTGPDGGGVAVTPFGFFVVPRSSAPLVVQDRQMPLGGGHGRIVERARFPALPEGAR